RSDFADYGYKHGVPMGGDITAAPDDASPRFLVRAVRDPDGANLDRIQVVKGWVDNDGATQERVFDIAASDDREIGDDGKYPAVGSTVNLEEASYNNSIGDAVMSAYWEDPEFDPRQRAFYYVRVIEIPTPNWVAYDMKAFGVSAPNGSSPEDFVHQERAYTSPIWYTP
ncbi:MAG: DUF3604 domain-containing protein, partial [Woeseiaceae bacterium]